MTLDSLKLLKKLLDTYFFVFQKNEKQRKYKDFKNSHE